MIHPSLWSDGADQLWVCLSLYLDDRGSPHTSFISNEAPSQETNHQIKKPIPAREALRTKERREIGTVETLRVLIMLLSFHWWVLRPIRAG